MTVLVIRFSDLPQFVVPLFWNTFIIAHLALLVKNFFSNSFKSLLGAIQGFLSLGTPVLYQRFLEIASWNNAQRVLVKFV